MPALSFFSSLAPPQVQTAQTQYDIERDDAGQAPENRQLRLGDRQNEQRDNRRQNVHPSEQLATECRFRFDRVSPVGGGSSAG